MRGREFNYELWVMSDEFSDELWVMILDENKPNRQKVIRDGQLIILRDGKSYSVMGQEL